MEANKPPKMTLDLTCRISITQFVFFSYLLKKQCSERISPAILKGGLPMHPQQLFHYRDVSRSPAEPLELVWQQPEQLVVIVE
ncbi:hypothetical protein SAMN05660330_00911 [Desulforhopalus singaporensis]|uniref:Uncharacterized protein n=1 Tax=Desulforhopalus singaporensis TaxID=91360 RepID=A0A1H0LYN9_9BACT|nr:hypothetical protein SAMN05660330_00911 [Desulforhopalus singaporensis]